MWREPVKYLFHPSFIQSLIFIYAANICIAFDDIELETVKIQW